MCPLLLCTTYFPHSHSKYLNIPSSISFYNLNSYYPLHQFQKAIRNNLNWTHIVGTQLLILNLCFWSTREKCKTNRRRYKGCLVCRAAKSSIVEHFSIEENLYRILSKSKLKFLVYKHNGGIGGWWWRGWLHDQRGFKQPFCSFAKYSMRSRQHRCTALNEHTRLLGRSYLIAKCSLLPNFNCIAIPILSRYCSSWMTQFSIEFIYQVW